MELPWLKLRWTGGALHRHENTQPKWVTAIRSESSEGPPHPGEYRQPKQHSERTHCTVYTARQHPITQYVIYTGPRSGDARDLGMFDDEGAGMYVVYIFIFNLGC